MIKSHWATNDYPTFADRICVDGDNIGIASGYGNTHDSITKMKEKS